MYKNIWVFNQLLSLFSWWRKKIEAAKNGVWWSFAVCVHCFAFRVVYTLLLSFSSITIHNSLVPIHQFIVHSPKQNLQIQRESWYGQRCDLVEKRITARHLCLEIRIGFTFSLSLSKLYIWQRLPWFTRAVLTRPEFAIATTNLLRNKPP